MEPYDNPLWDFSEGGKSGNICSVRLVKSPLLIHFTIAIDVLNILLQAAPGLIKLLKVSGGCWLVDRIQDSHTQLQYLCHCVQIRLLLNEWNILFGCDKQLRKWVRPFICASVMLFKN